MVKQTPKLNLLVRKKNETIFSGPVNAVSSTNETGPFDVLPFHARFVGMVRNYIRIYLDGGIEKDFEIPKGVMHVKDDVVEVYVGV